MELIKDLGMRYPTNKSKRKARFGIYKCPVCKKLFETQTYSVRSNTSTKCKKCARTIHGGEKTKLYYVWASMKNRCYCSTFRQFKDYGGRGITVCKEWIKFENFLKWANDNGYNEKLTVDRIDNDGNYTPDNCRWTTRKIQARNTRPLRLNNTSRFRGVSFSNARQRWLAQIMINYKGKFLGYFDYPWTAAYAYDAHVLRNNLEHTRNFT